MVHATDAAAENVHRALLIAIIVIGIAISMCLWMEALGLNENAHKLGLIGATLISSTMFSFFALRRRADVAGILLGGNSDSQATWWRLFARTWYGLVVVYATAAFCVTVARLVLDIPDVFALVTGPVIVLLGSLSLFAVALLVIERTFSRKGPSVHVMQPIGGDDDETEEIADSVLEAMEDDEAYALELHHRSFKRCRGTPSGGSDRRYGSLGDICGLGRQSGSERHHRPCRVGSRPDRLLCLARL